MPPFHSKYLEATFMPEMELRRRELGFKPSLGWEAKLRYSLYSNLIPSSSWSPNTSNSPRRRHSYGGIFNLEFSPDGRKLVAACERQTVLMFDPVTRQEICKLDNAHTDCVNGIKFLDSRLFASCSDDTTVAIWDVRNLKKKVSVLEGHRNWVKNVEYSPNEGLVVTSAFDGKILGWDINDFTETGLKKTQLFTVDGLMRTRLTPDGSKLCICTSKGYMLLINNLSLLDLGQDSINRSIDDSATNDYMKKRNRVEYINDFPRGNNAEMIHSLQIHPQGWCALSRNTSSQNESEWTCVHDIQDPCKKSESDEQSVDNSAAKLNRYVNSITAFRRRRLRMRPMPSRSDLSSENSATIVRRDPESPNAGGEVRYFRNNDRTWYQRIHPIHDPDDFTERVQNLRSSYFFMRNRRREMKANEHPSTPRLTNYIEELNRGPGFIKELCFSPDGRLICSPYDTGIRLMMFDSNCSELSHCVQNTAQCLHTISTNICHMSCVVSTKFSPTDCILVSGSLDGEIVWHQPVL